jgi:hypothetical protein
MVSRHNRREENHDDQSNTKWRFSFHQINSIIKHRQPNRRLIWTGPFNPMSLMGWNQNMIADLEMNRFFRTFDQKFRVTFQNNDPFGVLLIVPKSFWTGLTMRNNSFYSGALTFRSGFDDFFGEIVR